MVIHRLIEHTHWVLGFVKPDELGGNRAALAQGLIKAMLSV